MAVPNVTSPSTATATLGSPFSYQITTDSASTVTAYGNDGGTAVLPGGISLNATTGLISGTPTTTGSFPLPLYATNTDGTGPLCEFTLTIGSASK